MSFTRRLLILSIVAVIVALGIAAYTTNDAHGGKPISSLCCPEGSWPTCWCGPESMPLPCVPPWYELGMSLPSGTTVICVMDAP